MEMQERVAVLETQVSTLFHKSDAADRKLEGIHELAQATAMLAKSMNDMNAKVNGIDKRLDTIEKAPGEDLKYYRRAAIAAVVTGIIGIILGAVSALIIK